MASSANLPEDSEEQIDVLIKLFQKEDKSLWKQIKDTIFKNGTKNHRR